MKTTIKLKLKASRRELGSGILSLGVTRHRITRTVSTSYVLSSDEWDENKQSIIFLENISSRRKKELVSIECKLKQDLQALNEAISVLEAHGDYSSSDLILQFRYHRHGIPFCTYVLSKSQNLRQEKRFGTAHTYQYAAVSFLKLLGNKDAYIGKINSYLMENYERYLLSQGRSKNTVSCYMRALRAAYNTAIREKVLVVKKTNENPFSNVFTGNAKTIKRAIDKESISKLMQVKAPKLSFSRDLFLFSFYTQGMSFSEMVNLKKDNITEGVIRYYCKKKRQLITIQLEDCMKEIINRYADGNSDFIFPVLRDFEDSDKDYEKWRKTATALAAYNRNLKKLAASAGIEEELSSYASRHYWVSIDS